MAANTAAGAITLGSGQIARRLGIGDIETMLAEGKRGMLMQTADDLARAAADPAAAASMAKGMPRKMVEGFLTEGLLEELPQSAQEQILQNIGDGKEWSDGVDAQAVMGALSGGVMGAGAAGFRGLTERGRRDVAGNTPLDQAATNTVATDTAEQEPPAAPPPPPDVPLLPAPTISVDTQGAASTAADRNTRLQRINSGDVTDVTPIPGSETRRPSEAMGLDPNQGPLTSAAAIAVDSGASPAPAAEAANTSDLPASPPPASGQAAAGTNDLSQWSDGTLSAAFRGAQVPEIRRQLADELRRRREARAQATEQPAVSDSAQTAAPEPAVNFQPTKEASNESQADQTQQASAQPAQAGAAPGIKQRGSADVAAAGAADHAAAPAAAAAGALTEKQQKGIARVAKGTAHFFSQAKAQAFIDDHDLSATHGLRKQGRAFFVETKQAQAAPSTGFKPLFDGDTPELAARRKAVDDQNAAEVTAQLARVRELEGSLSVHDGKVYRRIASDMYQSPAANQVKPLVTFPQITTMIWERPEADIDAPYAKTLIERARKAGKAIEGLAPAAQTAAVTAAANEAATSKQNSTPAPTEAQIEAGNYKKGHLSGPDVQGLDITIENPKGSVRSGTDENGKPWSVTMPEHYGYVRGSKAADGEHVDVTVGPHSATAPRVWVVDQINQKTGAYDEAKALFGFNTRDEALAAYRSSFEPGWKVGPVTEMTVAEFKQAVEDDRLKKPLGRIARPQNPPAPEVRPEAQSSAPARAPAQPSGNTGRAMRPNEEGRPVDGKPLMPGDTFLTASGRVTTPFPKAKSELATDRWLAENAEAEAAARGDDFNGPVFARMVAGLAGKTKKERLELSPGDRDTLNLYLWSKQPAVVKPITHPLASKAEAPKLPAQDQAVVERMPVHLTSAERWWDALPAADRQGVAADLRWKAGESERAFKDLSVVKKAQIKKRFDGDTAAATFIPAPGGGLDYGEITPAMAKAMGRQAGKIRLTQGVQRADGSGYGLAHIEARHGEQIRALGFGSVADFVSHVAHHIQEVWQAPGVQLLVTARSGRKDVMYVQLDVSKEGDFYRVNSAFPMRDRNYETRHKMKKLWPASEPQAEATGQPPAFVAGNAEVSSSAGPNAITQSGPSVAEKPVADNPAAATHQDGGQAPEPATQAVVNASLDKAKERTSRTPAQMRAWILGEIDKAIEQAPAEVDAFASTQAIEMKPKRLSVVATDAEGKPRIRLTAVRRDGDLPGWSVTHFVADDPSMPIGQTRMVPLGRDRSGAVSALQRMAWREVDPAGRMRTFDVPGDGVFKVVNTKERLQAFRKQVEKSPGFRAERASQSTPANPQSASTQDAIADMVAGGDFQAALDYATARGVDLKSVKLPKSERQQLDEWLKLGRKPTPEAIADAARQEDVRVPPDAKSVPAEVAAEQEAQLQADIKAERARGNDALADRIEADAASDGANTRSPATKTVNLQDFGEKIGGARKDVWTDFKAGLDAVPDDAIGAQPLSKVWPAPDYQALISGGMNARVAAAIRALRDEVPPKPRASYKVKWWAERVKTLRDFARDIADGKITIEAFENGLGAVPALRDNVLGRIDLYEAVGHAKSLEGVRFGFHRYSLYHGKENVSLWVVNKDAKATSLSNWPTEIATGKTREEALANFKKAYPTLGEKAVAPSFDIWSERGKDGFFVGKKVGRNYAKLAGPFATVKEARAYRLANDADLAERLQKFKEIPRERGDVNQPRVGEDMRGGADVTPQQFGDAFGFRGVEFGNYVEQKRRQQDLNDAYDALMDMAAVLGIPPKAISLNGQLGLAFGARGSGGKNAPMAHYERGKVVINLTKTKGAGSIGHEWWHALDNYFSRLRGHGDEMMTSARDVSLASRDSPFVHQGEVRKEMVQAYGAVLKAIRQTALRARSAKLDARRTKEYWTTNVEMSARAFESYLISKLQDHDAANDYLANVVSPETWEAASRLGFELEDSYPYPTAGEMPTIRAAFDHFFDTVQTRPGESGNVALFSRHDQSTQTRESGVPTGLPSERNADSDRLEQGINDFLRQTGRPAGFKAEAIRTVSLPDALAVALARFTDATGTRVVLFRNRTPGVDDFNGVNFRDGRIYINEASQHPLTLTAAHEWTHNLKRTHPALYQQLEDEVRRQGRIPEWHARNIREEGMDRGRDHAVEELTAAAVSDALTDPVFLQRLAERDQGVFRRVAHAFLDFLKTLTNGWRDQGSNAYLRDVEAFRDKLAAVLGQLPVTKQGPGAINALFLRVWHGTPHRGIEQTGFKLNKIGSGEGNQSFGWGMYFAGKREVAEGYRRRLSSQFPLRDALLNGVKLPDQNGFLAVAIRTLDANVHWSGISFTEARDMAVRDLRSRATREAREGNHSFAAEVDDAARALEHVSADQIGVRDVISGQLYSAEIPGDQELLDWDKPLSEQPPDVRAALDREGLIQTRDQQQREQELLRITMPTGTFDDFLTDQTDAQRSADQELRRPKKWVVRDGESGQALYRQLVKSKGGEEAASNYLRSIGIPGLRYLDGMSRNKPLRDIKREFLAELPEDASFEDVNDLLGTGKFSTKNEAFLKALAADDWLGFDFPAQAVSAALGRDAGNFEMSPALQQTIADAQEGGTHNYVVWDEKLLTPEAAQITPAFSRQVVDAPDAMSTSRSFMRSALDQVHATLSHPGKVSMWSKTVGSMRDLAERRPEFKPVYDTAQRFIDDVSMLANDAANMAPRILPRIDSWRDLGKHAVAAADSKAVAKPIFDGTLLWARNKAGKPIQVKDVETDGKPSAAGIVWSVGNSGAC